MTSIPLIIVFGLSLLLAGRAFWRPAEIMALAMVRSPVRNPTSISKEQL